MHPRLRELFAAWQRRSLSWTLLRVPSTPAAPSGDVDVLVAPGDLSSLQDTAAELGFLALPGWESAPKVLLVGHDARSGRWLLLDICTDISFHSPRSWRLDGVAEEVLARRCATAETVLPADGDAFWLLLLHCVLDKHSIPGHYRVRLNSLAPAGGESNIGMAICALAGGRVTPDALLASARSQQWGELLALGQDLAAELKSRRTVHDGAAAARATIIAALRKPLLLRRRRGLSIALLGPDGVGKSTVAAQLQRSFPFGSHVLYMGLWKAAASNRGRGRARTIVEVALRPLRLWAHYLIGLYHQLRGHLVIFDRYVYEALLPPKPPLATLKRIYYWFLAHLIPRPATVVVLDAPGRVAYARKQESSPRELDRERRTYAALAERIPSLELVDAAAPADVVHAQISALVWRESSRRWHPSGMS